ncbi:hypothetical protein SARC_04865 [Sphaeroforma arctica JP610]|uniref:Uncharacterized protein n=1 Tax=Sphaeroforma arctica JP610 TaxID=667725 RepID=A0A0L0G209_9EUKA|nr:hypothetical protein SARC_04865 [Sphaeroforma arctica JP610]KNC82866.1 hypothetical protein SARC_04865 [Sphaeroforma arctica JP610]|eukprot:XP_014156768.1 hypothetical protein SARC_04865 [Sphaeroforma arctica JP610]
MSLVESALAFAQSIFHAEKVKEWTDAANSRAHAPIIIGVASSGRPQQLLRFGIGPLSRSHDLLATALKRRGQATEQSDARRILNTTPDSYSRLIRAQSMLPTKPATTLWERLRASIGTSRNQIETASLEPHCLPPDHRLPLAAVDGYYPTYPPLLTVAPNS